MDMMPSPPSWISSSTTTWPVKLRSVAMDFTISPVTDAALAAVNSASVKLNTSAPGARQAGSSSKPVPASTSAEYHANSVRAG